MIIRIIQLTDDQVTLARFSVRRREMTFLAAGRAERSSDRELQSILQELAEPLSADERVVLTVPPRQVSVRQLSLPLTDRPKVRDVLPIQLKGELAQDTTELVFDALPAGKGNWTVCWLPVSVMSSLLAAVEGAGSDVECATYGPACWGGLIPAADQKLTVALSDGSGCTVFLAGVPVYMRSFSGPASRELQRTLAALEAGSDIVIDRLYLFGAAADDFLADPMEFPQHCSLLPTDGFLDATFSGDAKTAREYASLAAIAQSAAAGGPINFRQGGLAYTAGSERLRKSLRLSVILAICLVIALFAELAVRWQLLHRDMASLDSSISAIYREVFPKRKPVDEAAEVRVEIRRLAGSGGESALLTTLKILSDAMGEGIHGFTAVELDGTTVRLRGEASSLQAVNDLKGRLSGRLTGLELVESRSKGTDGAVAFVLRAGVAKGGAE